MDLKPCTGKILYAVKFFIKIWQLKFPSFTPVHLLESVGS